MHFIRSIQISAFAVLALFVDSAAAEDPLRLVCTGIVEQTTDLAKKERSQETVEVVVDAAASTIEIEGYWGCTADTAIADPAKYHCLGKQPITVSDSEFRFLARSENEMFEGQTSLAINRYSGAFWVNSSAIAKRAAAARWSYISITARLECSPQKKRF